jgi:very-short-patch-repair endonuclease
MFQFTPRDLRRHSTVAEHILWSHLRARRMIGLKFRRQHAMGPYIADFVCLQEKIVIEVDGLIHEDQRRYDASRDRWFQSKGYFVLRIKNEDLETKRLETLINLRAVLLDRINKTSF